MSELDHYDYDLPKELVAQQPPARRADARLMLVDRRLENIAHYYVRDLPELLRARDALVLNDTRVIPARLVGSRTLTGGRWEGLFLSDDAQGNWRVLCRARGKLTTGETIRLRSPWTEQELELRLLLKEADGSWIVRPQSADPAPELLERVGWIPLPKYIRQGEMQEDDRRRYQTVYAQHPGSVAAPTAGLHFTSELLADLAARGVAVVKVTLHVGLGTFRPITAQRLDEHPMHAEWGRLDPAACQALEQARQAGGRIVAVGTTSTRVLETAAAGGSLAPWEGPTRLFLRPGSTFRAVDVLMTNFHLPRTTLLVLVRAFGGERLMQRAYQAAVAERYRFYSYGDAMLIV
jgi:S-adenosylmethionine:tRNA ribosyltransferase-isomerase